MKPTELIRRIDELLEREEAFVLVKAVRAAPESDIRSGQAWIVHEGFAESGGPCPQKKDLSQCAIEGPPASEELAAFLRETACRVSEERRSRSVPFEKENAEFFFDPIAAPETLVIAGGGHIAIPLAEMAARTGFRVVVVEDRPEFASRERFPDAHDIVIGPFGETLEGLPGGPRAYFVIITRGHIYDRECLEAVMRKESAYVGMIGSRRRIKAVFESLAREGARQHQLDRIHSPIGLNIGARTPAEIAVSILAELVAVRHGVSSEASLSEKRRSGKEPGKEPRGK